MKVKTILRFYFSADSLERHLNNLIYKKAANSYFGKDCLSVATEVQKIIDAKEELGGLYGYVNSVLSYFKCDEIETLKSYADMRCGLSKLDEEKRKQIRRVAIKFTRHVSRGVERFENAVKIVYEYYCVLK